jgi:hypothetical protein
MIAEAAWKIGEHAPPDTHRTAEFFRDLGDLVGNHDCATLGNYLVSELGAVTIGLLKQQVTAVDMREALQHLGMKESYADTIAMFLTGPNAAPHKFKVARVKRDNEGGGGPVGGHKLKKLCRDRPTISIELGGPDALTNVFDKLGAKLSAWCTVQPKVTRLDQGEVNTISACFLGVTMAETNNNMYTDSNFLDAAAAFLQLHWPVLNCRGKAEHQRTW